MRQLLATKLELIRARILNDADITKDLEMYIPLRGAYRIQDATTFDLDTRIEQFKSEPKRVLLLMSEMGGGKSTFARFLQRKMWSEYKFGDTIPLFLLTYLILIILSLPLHPYCG